MIDITELPDEAEHAADPTEPDGIRELIAELAAKLLENLKHKDTP